MLGLSFLVDWFSTAVVDDPAMLRRFDHSEKQDIPGDIHIYRMQDGWVQLLHFSFSYLTHKEVSH